MPQSAGKELFEAPQPRYSQHQFFFAEGSGAILVALGLIVLVCHERELLRRDTLSPRLAPPPWFGSLLLTCHRPPVPHRRDPAHRVVLGGQLRSGRRRRGRPTPARRGPHGAGGARGARRGRRVRKHVGSFLIALRLIFL